MPLHIAQYGPKECGTARHHSFARPALAGQAAEPDRADPLVWHSHGL